MSPTSYQTAPPRGGPDTIPGSGAAPSAAAAAVRTGDDLEEVPVGVVEVHPAPAVVAVDPPGLRLPGVGPVVDAALEHPAEDGVELLLAHEERVVLCHDVA